MTIGEKIKALRKKLNLTQEAFADSIKVSRRSIMDWEHDKYTPQTESIMEICKVYNIDLSYFIDDDSEVTSKSEEEQTIDVIKNNIIIDINDKAKYKKEILSKYKIYKWYRLFAFIAIISPFVYFIIYMMNEDLIDLLSTLLFITPLVFYLLFRYFRKKYALTVMTKLREEVIKNNGALQLDYPLYVNINDDVLSFMKKDQLLINIKTSDIKHISLFLNDSMMNEVLPPVTNKVYFITMHIYYNDGSKSIVSVDYDFDTKVTKEENNFNKLLLIEKFNKIYIKYKK